jgi:DinB superfamily
MTGRLPKDWESLSADHQTALQQFVGTVRQLPPGSWTHPLAPDKWTPAEISSHLIASYRIMRAELAGGPGMALRLKPLQRWVLRLTVLPGILRSGSFPVGARAPRETRPVEVVQNLPESLEILATEANALVEELTQRASSGRVRLTHAYFGGMSPRQSLRLLAVHTRHHARQIAGLHP